MNNKWTKSGYTVRREKKAIRRVRRLGEYAIYHPFTYQRQLVLSKVDKSMSSSLRG